MAVDIGALLEEKAKKKKKQHEEHKKQNEEISSQSKVITNEKSEIEHVNAISSRTSYDGGFNWDSSYVKTANANAKKRTQSGVDIGKRIDNYISDSNSLHSKTTEYYNSGYEAKGNSSYIRKLHSDLRAEAKEIYNQVESNKQGFISKYGEDYYNSVVKQLKSDIKTLKSNNKNIGSYNEYLNSFETEEDYNISVNNLKMAEKYGTDLTYEQVQENIKSLENDKAAMLHDLDYNTKLDWLKNYAYNYGYKDEDYYNKQIKSLDEKIAWLEDINTDDEELEKYISTLPNPNNEDVGIVFKKHLKELKQQKTSFEMRRDLYNRTTVYDDNFKQYENEKDYDEYAQKGALEQIGYKKQSNSTSDDSFAYLYYEDAEATNSEKLEAYRLDNAFSPVNTASLVIYFHDNEKKTYNYLLGKYGVEKAKEYYESMERTLTARREEYANKAHSNFSKNANFGEKLVQGIGTILLKPVGVVSNTIGNIKGLFDEESVDPYDDYHQIGNTVDKTREYEATHIENSIDSEILGKLASTAYQSANSIADMGVAIGLGAVTGGGSAVSGTLFGLDSANSYLKSAYDRGLSKGQMYTGAVLTGIAEGFFEKFSLDKIIKMKPGNVKQLVLNTLKSAGIEASEEMATEFADIVIDNAVANSNSENNLEKARLIREEGLSQEEAERKVFVDNCSSVLWSGVGGMLAGFGFGGVSGAVQYANNTATLNSDKAQEVGKSILLTDKQQEVLEKAKELGIDTSDAEFELNNLNETSQIVEQSPNENNQNAYNEAFERTSKRFAELELYIEQSGETATDADIDAEIENAQFNEAFQRELDGIDAAQTIEAELRARGTNNTERAVNYLVQSHEERTIADEVKKLTTVKDESGNVVRKGVEAKGVLPKDYTSEENSIESFYKSQGKNTVIFDSDSDVDGFTFRDTVYLNRNNAKKYVFKHEFSHTQENKQGFKDFGLHIESAIENSKRLSTWVDSKAKNIKGYDKNATLKEKIALVKKHYNEQRGGTLSNTGEDYEFYADFVMDNLYNGKDVETTVTELKRAFADDKTVWQRFCDFMRRLLKNIKNLGIYDGAKITKLENEFAKVVRTEKTVAKTSQMGYNNSTNNKGVNDERYKDTSSITDDTNNQYARQVQDAEQRDSGIVQRNKVERDTGISDAGTRQEGNSATSEKGNSIRSTNTKRGDSGRGRNNSQQTRTRTDTKNSKRSVSDKIQATSQKYARKIAREQSIRDDSAKNKIESLVRDILVIDNKGENSYEKIVELADVVAKNTSSISERNDYYDVLLEQVKGYGIKISDSVKSEFDEDWNEFRLKNSLRMGFRKNGHGSVDEAYDDLSENFGLSGTAQGPAEQLKEIANALDGLKGGETVYLSNEEQIEFKEWLIPKIQKDIAPNSFETELQEDEMSDDDFFFFDDDGDLPFSISDTQAEVDAPAFSISENFNDEEHNEVYADAVKKHFGVTYNWNETGYILADGTKLDFSGKNMGARGGSRTVDHREINQFAFEEDNEFNLYLQDLEGSEKITDFLNRGNIRIMPENAGICLSVKPTEQQITQLKNFISRNNGEVTLDISDETGNIVASLQYPKYIKSDVVINDIIDYFDKGRVPQEFGGVSFSISEQQDIDYLKAVESGDMETAQKMVDEVAEEKLKDSKGRTKDGKLRRFYHGTNSDFYEFSKDYTGTASGDTGFFGEGFYFAFTKGEASYYGRKVKEVFLNYKNPFVFRDLLTYNNLKTHYADKAVFAMNFSEQFPTLAKKETIAVSKNDEIVEISFDEFKKQFDDVLNNVKFETKVNEYDDGSKSIRVVAGAKKMTDIDSDGKEYSWTKYDFEMKVYDEDTANDILNNVYCYLEKVVYEKYISIPSPAQIITSVKFSDELIKKGYDACIQSEDGDEVVVYNPNQIKSAEAVVYDDDGNVIPLSKRFDEGQDDIRFSISDDVNITKNDIENNIKEVANMDSVSDLDGTEFAKSEVDLVTQVDNYFKTFNEQVDNSVLGTVDITTRGIKDSIAHGLGRNKAIAFKAVPFVIENGLIIDYQPNWKNRGYDTFVLGAPITIKGENYYEAVVVIREKQNQRFYVHEVITEKRTELSFKTGTTKSGVPGDNSSPSIFSLLEKIKNVNPKLSVSDDFDNLVDEYGAIPEGMNAERDIAVPKRTSENQFTSYVARSIMEKGSVDNATLEQIKEQVVNEALSHKRWSDEEALDYAQKQLEDGEAEIIWNDVVSGKTLLDKNKIAVAEGLLEMYANEGKADKVLTLTAELCEVGTRAGQVVQAFSLLKNMGGVGRLYYLQKVTDSINRDIEKKFGKNKKRVKIEESLATRMMNAKSDGEVQKASEDIMKSLGEQVPPTFLDKWNAWRYLSMLGNPRTHIRNLVGNAIFMPAISIKNGLATAMEHTFIRDVNNRTKAIKVSKEVKEFAEKDFEQMKEFVSSGGKYQDGSQIQEYQRVFKSKVLEGLRKFNFDMLEKEDIIFLKYHYKRAFGQFITARKLDVNNLTEKQLWEAREYATLEAQKATYRDASAVAEAINRLSHNNVISNVLIEGILPFKKTPINILKRGVEYSPIGLIKTLTKGSVDLRKGKITASQYIDGISSGLAGTGIMALGILLGSLGVAIGGMGDDEDKWFRKQNGEQEYSITLWGKSYTVDWAAPSCIPFFIGVELQKILSGENENWVTAFVNALDGALEPLTNLSMLQGINDTLETIKWSDSPSTSIVIDSITSYFTQALPTLAGQITRTFDGTRRKNYVDKTSAVPEWLQRVANTVSSKTGNWGKNPYRNAWGETEVDESLVGRIVSNFLSPGYYSKIDYDAVNAEIKELYNAKGNKLVLPDTVDTKINVNGKYKYLNADEYEKYQVETGQNAYKYIDEVIKSSFYKNADDDTKVDMIANVYSYCENIAKTTVSDYELSSADLKLKLYLERGVTLAEYMEAEYSEQEEESEDIKTNVAEVNELLDDIEGNYSDDEKMSMVDFAVKYIRDKQKGKLSKANEFATAASEGGYDIGNMFVANSAYESTDKKEDKINAIRKSDADEDEKFLSMAYVYLDGRKVTYKGKEEYFSKLSASDKLKYISANENAIRAGIAEDY